MLGILSFVHGNFHRKKKGNLPFSYNSTVSACQAH
jgi:hypothetical protein